jgi:hypothetical protein
MFPYNTESRKHFALIYFIRSRSKSGRGTHFFQLHRSGAHRFCSALQDDQITTSERPGGGLFSLGEVQTLRVRPPTQFSDFI